MGHAAVGEEIDILLRLKGGVADGEHADADVARHQHARGPFRRGMGAGALERFAVQVVNMRRPVDADRDRDVVGLETVQPFIVDQHAVGGHGDRDVASGPFRDGFAGLRDAPEILHAPQQRLAAMQDDRKIDQGMLDDVLLDPQQQLLQHLGAHQLGLVIDRQRRGTSSNSRSRCCISMQPSPAAARSADRGRRQYLERQPTCRYRKGCGGMTNQVLVAG